MELQASLADRIQVTMWWVPSHGKVAPHNWRCPPCGEATARALNARGGLRMGKAGLACPFRSRPPVDGWLAALRTVSYGFVTVLAPSLLIAWSTQFMSCWRRQLMAEGTQETYAS